MISATDTTHSSGKCAGVDQTLVAGLMSMFDISRREAEDAIDICNGNFEIAAERLSAVNNFSQFIFDAYCSELATLAGISQAEASELLLESKGDIKKAKKAIADSICEKSGSIERKPSAICCNIICPICDSTSTFEECLIIDECGHTFCRVCLTQWIKTQHEEGRGLDISCPSGKDVCLSSLSQKELKALIGDVEYAKYDRRSLESVISTDPNLHFCPTPDCAYIFSWIPDEGTLPLLDCPICGKSICVNCKQEPFHHGQTCGEVGVFERGAGGGTSDEEVESLTVAFLESGDMRTCKRCNTKIQKTSGCDKMKCRCGYKFCFRCGTENATCGCTPAEHGFWDNELGRGDFSRIF